jgi:T4-like virus tail tube protein gp19
MPITTNHRDYPTGSSLLELSGTFAGPVLSTEGGDATSDVIQEKLGSDAVVRKHLAGVRYTDIELECDARMERNFFDWIRDTLNHKFMRKSGAISLPDSNHQVGSRVEFADALLTGVSFPALDVESKDAVSMTVKLTPEYTRRQKGPGLQSAPVGPKGRTGWTAANFRLAIDGLDCTHVTKIERLAFTTVVNQQLLGEVRDYMQQPYQLDVPDVVLTVPESRAASFFAWHDDFVIKGMNGPQYEKSGTLEFLDPNEKDTLLTLELKNLGIYKLARVKPSATGEIAQVRASMYCEEITLSADGIAPPASSPLSQEAPAPVPVAAPAGAAVPAPPGANGGEPTPIIMAREPGELMRIRPADVQTEPVDVPTDDGVGTSAATATSLGTIPPGASITFDGVRGPSKPAWFYVTMPCSDSCTARLQMTGGPAFNLFGPSFQTPPLATGLTLGDVSLSPALTQFYVNVPAGPWARYKLAIFRS